MASPRRSLLVSLALVSCLLAFLALVPRSSARELHDKSSITGLQTRIEVQEEISTWFQGTDDWDETELEMDGAGEDFPQERPLHHVQETNA